MAPEMISHLFRDYPDIASMWGKLVLDQFSSWFWRLNGAEWMKVNLRRSRGEMAWSVVFGVASWFIWKARNEMVFNQENPDFPGMA